MREVEAEELLSYLSVYNLKSLAAHQYEEDAYL